MTDPWDTAANNLTAARKAAEQLAAAQATRQADADAADRLYRQQEAELQALVDEVTPVLEAFVAQRGGPAQRLLAASARDHKFVRIGTMTDGGYFDTIVFDEWGFARFTGYEGGQGGGTVSSRKPATARQAVEYFARYERNAPDQVRRIVAWLENEIDRHMPR